MSVLPAARRIGRKYNTLGRGRVKRPISCRRQGPALGTRVEGADAAVLAEVGPLPEGRQSEYRLERTALQGQPVPFQEPQLLKALEDPERDVDQDTLGVEDPAVGLFGQSIDRPVG